MSYTLRSIDQCEMWGPADTIECIRYNREELSFMDSKYRYYCSKAEDYARVNWIVHKLNKNNVKLEHLDLALECLEGLYVSVKEQVERDYYAESKRRFEAHSKKIQEEQALRRSSTKKKRI